MRRMVVALVLLAACGDDSGGGGGDDAGVLPDAAVPVARCNAPPLADVSTPTTVIGDGTAASCTAAAIQTAATAGGIITFSCGATPVTITVTSTITITKATVIDGGGLEPGLFQDHFD